MRHAHSSADNPAPPAALKMSSVLRKWVPVGLALLILGWFTRGFIWSLIEGFMLNVLPIVFTPVILELSVGFVGLFIVLMFAHMRRKDQADEWVYIAQVEPEAEMEAIPEPLRKRVSETVLTAPSAVVAEDELPFQAIEGMIDLGMLEDAERELAKGTEGDRRLPAYARLHLMLLLHRESWSDADRYVGATAAPPERLAVVCVEVARSFIKQKPANKEAARQCLELGKKISVSAVLNAIDTDGRLQKLA
ncbi:MAG: hypothetical protein ACR2RV_12960 [Verrucomicrobiales bacterium]